MRGRIIVTALVALACLVSACHQNVAQKAAETSAKGQAPQAVITQSESGGPQKVRKVELASQQLWWADALPIESGWVWTTYSHDEPPRTTIWGLNGQDPLEKPVKIAEYSLPLEESTARATEDKSGNVRVFFGYAGFRTVSTSGGKFSVSDLNNVSFDASRDDRFSTPIPISKDQMLTSGRSDKMAILSLSSGEATPLQLSGWPSEITVVRSGVVSHGYLFLLAEGNALARPYAAPKCYVCRASLKGDMLSLDAYRELPARPTVPVSLFSRMYGNDNHIWLSYANVLYAVDSDLNLKEVLRSEKVAALLSVNGHSVLELYSNARGFRNLRDF